MEDGFAIAASRGIVNRGLCVARSSSGAYLSRCIYKSFCRSVSARAAGENGGKTTHLQPGGGREQTSILGRRRARVRRLC